MKFNLTIRRKILIGCVGTALISCIVLAITASTIVTDSVVSIAKNNLSNIANSLLNLSKTCYEINQRTAQQKLDIADFFTKGNAKLDQGTPIKIKTEQNKIINIPRMLIDNNNVSNDPKLPEKISKLINGKTTIFQKIVNPKGLISISCSKKGKIGTFVPGNSTIYKTIIQNNIYWDSEVRDNKWYINGYKPIYDDLSDKVIGALAIELDSAAMDILKTKILSLFLGSKGKNYIIDNNINNRGNLIVHFSEEGQNISNIQDSNGTRYIKTIYSKINKKNPQTYSGELVYFHKNSEGNINERIINYRYFSKMDWIIIAEADAGEIYSSIHFLKKILIILTAVCFVFILIISIFIADSISGAILQVVKGLNNIKDGNFDWLVPEKFTKREDEIGAMSSNFNKLVKTFKELISQIKNSTEVLNTSINDLSVSAKEISSTSNQQAAAVKEIVTTMEDSDQLAKSVSGKTQEVAKISIQNKEEVYKGFEHIKNNLSKMDEIKVTNSDTILGIKSLSDQIDNIWDVVNIINGIADQTKIIAFNAELEASSAGEVGKNFQIVATEIRRLADNTVSSTNEIKNKINEIQRASDKLIIASENGTEKIKEGWQLSGKLKEIFENILSSSEISASSAQQIVSSVNQQVAAFEQILLTLKQISEGIDNFVTSTKNTTQASEALKKMGENLNKILNAFQV